MLYFFSDRYEGDPFALFSISHTVTLGMLFLLIGLLFYYREQIRRNTELPIYWLRHCRSPHCHRSHTKYLVRFHRYLGSGFDSSFSVMQCNTLTLRGNAL